MTASHGSARGQDNDKDRTVPLDATPGDTTPLDATPGDATPLDATPGDATPLDAASGDATPPDSTPLDATPLETAPRDSTPRETTPPKTAPLDSTPPPSEPQARPLPRRRPLFATIFWGALMLALAGFLAARELIPGGFDPVTWLLAAVLGIGVVLVVAGIAAASRRAG